MTLRADAAEILWRDGEGLWHIIFSLNSLIYLVVGITAFLLGAGATAQPDRRICEGPSRDGPSLSLPPIHYLEVPRIRDDVLLVDRR